MMRSASEQAAIKDQNMFAVLMEASKYCSRGQLTAAMFEYRRDRQPKA